MCKGVKIEMKGKERKGNEMKGKEMKGKEMKGNERKTTYGIIKHMEYI